MLARAGKVGWYSSSLNTILHELISHNHLCKSGQASLLLLGCYVLNIEQHLFVLVDHYGDEQLR